MKFLRSQGSSFTTPTSARGDKDQENLSRGLQLSSAERNRVEPAELSDYLESNYLLALRQIVAVLDKILRKPPNLRMCDLETYVRRTRLSVELWDLYCIRYQHKIQEEEGGQDLFVDLQKTWLWKVHPYAREAFNPTKLETDLNAQYIQKFQEKRTSSWNGEGRWFKAFWSETSQGEPDYKGIAKKVFEHLWVQEIEIFDRLNHVRPRKNKGQKREQTGRGLVATRGNSIANSASDPRKKKDPDRVRTWSKEISNIYFETDIAAGICRAIGSKQRDIKKETKGANASVPRRSLGPDFGRLLFAHFKPVRVKVGEADLDVKQLWALHNSVREFYKKLAKSEGFRRAFYNLDPEELDKQLPCDKYALLQTLKARKGNADISRLVRLGKLVVHGSDFPPNTRDASTVFSKRMNWFSTSEGQKEIKRNEAFTRVWRNSVGLSLRTLKNWADPEDRAEAPLSNFDGNESQETNKDIASRVVAEKIFSKEEDNNEDIFDSHHYASHAQLIFGNKANAAWGKKKSRASLFIDGDDKMKRENLWAMLRLAGELRDKTNHFNTKPRLMSVLSGNIVKPFSSEGRKCFKDRLRDEVEPCSLKVFERLLKFDMSMQRQVLLEDLTRLDVKRYVDESKLGPLFKEVASIPDGNDVTLPKFISVLRRVKALSENEATTLNDFVLPFSALNLNNLSKSNEGVNHCKIGLLRLLYTTGFQSWLSEKQADVEFIQNAVTLIATARDIRSKEFNVNEGRHYAIAHSLASDNGLELNVDLSSLFGQLDTLSMREGGFNQSYKPNRGEQKDRAHWTEEFKQELFAYFFGRYLDDKELIWLWDLKDNCKQGEHSGSLSLAELPSPLPLLNENHESKKSWHGQFYAWLYLVPSGDISLLRHQFRKTAVLERGTEKSPSGRTLPDDMLEEMDALMGLYTRVQAAGFDGSEHLNAKFKKGIFYEDPVQFDLITSVDAENHNMSLPGTQRGLRQTLRFGTSQVLERIFLKHQVTTQEVRLLAPEGDVVARKKCRAEVSQMFTAKNDYHELIKKLNNKPRPDFQKLERQCRAYQDSAERTTLYNFQTNAARLTEHAHLHHLLMRIIGRLTDFALMWERDCSYIFLGMLYEQMGAENFVVVDWDSLEKSDRSSKKLGLQLLDAQRIKLKKEHNKRYRRGFLPIWHEKMGFNLPPIKELICLLDHNNRVVFEKYFIGLREENPRDIQANKSRTQRGETKRSSKRGVKKKKIRDDFAHYNIINNDRLNKVTKLTYRVNAIRSLLSYDRKLKNAVTKSISEIVRDEGLLISWQFAEDRLTKPVVTPILETHLDFLKTRELREEFSFKLPQASVRYTSMVKALFDFDPGGNRELVEDDGKQSCKGELGYPEAFRKKAGGKVPESMYQTYPSLKD